MNPRRLCVLLLVFVRFAGAEDDRPERRVKDPALQAGINAAIDKGVAYLESVQNRDGSWTYGGSFVDRGGGKHDATGGMTALALYALSASDVPADDPAITRGLRWAFKHKDPYTKGVYGTYCSSLLILALTRIAAKRHKSMIDKLAANLAKSQIESDMWSYKLKAGTTAKRRPRGPVRGPEFRGDNSNSQFAVLALWAAQEIAGSKVPRRTWMRINDFYQRTQRDDGSWAYAPRFQGRRGVNMTAAGLVSYVYSTAAMLGGVEALNMARAAPGTKKGLAFFMDRSRWRFEDYYFVYSLERVGTVLGQPTEEWYVFGAKKLVGVQEDTGRWRARRGGDEKDAYATSLALLFLNRATVRSITPGAH